MTMTTERRRSTNVDGGAVPPTGTWPLDRTDAANRWLAETPSQWTVDKTPELVEAEGRLRSLREEVADFDGLRRQRAGSRRYEPDRRAAPTG